MAKKKAKTNTPKGEQIPLIEVGPENLKHIVKEVRQYKYHQKQRLFHLKKECEQKEKVKALIAEAHLQRLKDGNIKFEAEGAIVCVTPQDDLITIKDKTLKKRKQKAVRTIKAIAANKSMKDQVKADELEFKKTTSKKPQKTVKQSATATQKKLKAAEKKEFTKRENGKETPPT